MRFHAWQAVLGLGLLGIAAVVFLGLAFVLLIVSPMAFWTMLWLAAATGAAWIGVWALCVVSAYKGRTLKLPLAGDYAERHAAGSKPAVLAKPRLRAKSLSPPRTPRPLRTKPKCFSLRPQRSPR